MRKTRPVVLFSEPGEQHVLISLQHACRMLSVSESHLSVLVKRGVLGPVVKLGPRTTRLRLSALRDFVASQTESSPEEGA
jgi:hypothetical protein